MKRLPALAIAALLGILPSGSPAQDRPGDFDFYVLALSWSPTWCATADAAGSSPQCDAGAGHGFIVHGLWPQHERGYPEYCGGDRPERVPSSLAAEMRDIMPDRQLAFHAWRKHGTCTGLPTDGYFAATRAAYDTLDLPPMFVETERDRGVSAQAVEAAFIAANPGLKAEGLAVSCEDGALEGVRICLTRDLAFRPCPEVDRRGCRQNDLRVPAPQASP